MKLPGVHNGNYCIVPGVPLRRHSTNECPGLIESQDKIRRIRLYLTSLDAFFACATHVGGRAGPAIFAGTETPFKIAVENLLNSKGTLLHTRNLCSCLIIEI